MSGWSTYMLATHGVFVKDPTRTISIVMPEPSRADIALEALEKLASKNRITNEEYQELLKMIKSPDEENLTIAEIIIETKI